MTLPLGDDTTQVNIAPVINGVALLGEAGKVTVIDTGLTPPCAAFNLPLSLSRSLSLFVSVSLSAARPPLPFNPAEPNPCHPTLPYSAPIAVENRL